jgi:hypothetical protein
MIVKTKTLLYPQQTVTRRLPVNLVTGDDYLFSGSNPADLKEVHLYSYENVNVSPEGIVFKGLSFDEDLLIYPKHKKNYNIVYLLSSYIKRKKISLPKNETYLLIFDYWSNSVFHWMCDALPRLEAIKEKAKEYVLLLPENFEYKYIHDSLKAYTFKSIFRIPLNSYVNCSHLISPGQITVSGEINPQNILSARSGILEYYKALFKNKFRYPNIYISRSKAKYRKILNENELLPVLKSSGFQIIYFEDMDFVEQVECCYHAKNIVSIHGANLTNTVFMQSKGNVLELRKNNDPLNNYFYALTDSVGCNYYYQNCETTDHIPGENFFDLKVDCELFEKNILLMLQNDRDL